MEVQVSMVNKSTMIVENVAVINASDENVGTDLWEQSVLDFCQKLFPSEDVIHVLTNRENRKNSGGVGYIYIQDVDDFYPPQTDEDLVLDEQTLTWVPPIPEPERTQEHIDNKQVWSWNSYTKEWNLHDENLVIPPWESLET